MASGIRVTEDVKKAFEEAQGKPKILYIEIGFHNTDFQIQTTVNGSVDSKAWAVLASALKPKTPTYLITRVGAPANKWLLIFYVPDDSNIKQKMMFASSVAALKKGLGSNLFTQSDFAISSPEECNEDSYNQSMKTFSKDEIMTASETAKQEAKDLSSKEVSDTKHQAMADIPLVVDDDANKELVKLKDGKLDLVVLAIDGKTEVLILKGTAQKISVDDIAKSTTHLPANEPRYLLFRYAHSFEEKTQTPIIFLYYRPENSSMKSKMTYSSMKQNVARIAEKAGIDIAKSYEFSESGELTSSVLIQELYPKSSEKKGFTKPRKPGKGASGLVSGAKFSSKK